MNGGCASGFAEIGVVYDGQILFDRDNRRDPNQHAALPGGSLPDSQGWDDSAAMREGDFTQ